MARVRTRLTVLGKVVAVIGLATLAGSCTAEHPAAAIACGLSLALLLFSLPARFAGRRLEIRGLAPGRLIEGEARWLDLEYGLRAPRSVLPLRLRSRCTDCSFQGRLLQPAVDSPGRSPLYVRGLHRGRVTRAEVAVETAAPFGLLLHRWEAVVPTDLWVLPRPRTLRESVLENLLSLRPLGLDRPQPTGPGEGEFYALREWREGDPERGVHARISARRGRKILRVFRGEAPPIVYLALDLRVPPSASRYQRADLDESLRFVAGILRSLLLRQVPVALFLVGADSVERACSPRARDLQTYLLALTQVAPVPLVDGDRPFPELPPGPRGGRRVLVHLGSLHGRPPPTDWIAIQVGSRHYFRLLESRYLAP